MRRWYLGEVAHPYEVFNAAGFKVTFASPKGGTAPVDEGSTTAAGGADDVCLAFLKDNKALTENTTKMSEITDVSGFDAVFFAGGFGTM